MLSKTSFFNKTLFRKNMTRFAPVWVIYTLCLVAGLALIYTDESAPTRCYWFAQALAVRLPQVMGAVNLVYALIAAQLLFGDLFNSRMCNAIHSLPLCREGWFVTNVLSGISFSLVPTLVMTAVAWPMLAGTIFENAWVLPLQLLLFSNLSFLCYFGIAAFCAMCVANRFTMIAGYGLVNFGAYIAYWMVDTLYTPLLYGVITPSRMALGLTPVLQMVDYSFYEVTPYHKLRNQMDLEMVELRDLTASFTSTGDGWRIWACAGVGAALLVVAMVLYRKRHLECAGNAVAFPVLVPVFQVLCSLFVMVAAQFFLRDFIGLRVEDWRVYIILALGLGIGWFIAKMLVERNTRVFRLKNFCGLGVLALAVALSMVGTHFDILGIEDRLPKAEKVEKVSLESNYTRPYMMESPEDIAAMMELHKLALEDRPQDWGLYVRGYDGSWVYAVDTNDHLIDTTIANPEFTYAANIRLIYYLENGATMTRRYNIWTETGAGPIARQTLSRWEAMDEVYDVDDIVGKESVMERILADLDRVSVDSYIMGSEVKEVKDPAEARELLNALKADCAAGTMAQDEHYHKDVFRSLVPVDRDGEAFYDEAPYMNLTFRGEQGRFYIHVYPDSENTVRWLQKRDLLQAEIVENTSPYWGGSGLYEKEAVEAG